MLDALHLADPGLRAATRDLLATKLPLAESAMDRVDAALSDTRAALLTLRGSDARSEQYRVTDGAIEALDVTRPRYAAYFVALAAYLRESADFVAFLSTPEANPQLTRAGTLQLHTEAAIPDFNRRAGRLDVLRQTLQEAISAIAGARDSAVRQLESLPSK